MRKPALFYGTCDSAVSNSAVSCSRTAGTTRTRHFCRSTPNQKPRPTLQPAHPKTLAKATANTQPILMQAIGGNLTAWKGVSMPLQTVWRPWKWANVVLCGSLLIGCSTSEKKLSYVGDTDLQHYKDVVISIDYPTVNQETPDTVSYSDEPRRIRNPRKDEIWNLGLEEACTPRSLTTKSSGTTANSFRRGTVC